jgi:phosphonate transport system permease protein
MESQKRKRSLYSSWGNILLIAIIVVAYIYGWRITDIDLKALITDAKDVVPIMRGLITPIVLSRPEKEVKIRTDFRVPCSENPPEGMESSSEPYFILSSTCGVSGERISLDGYNFHPGAEGRINWVIVNTRRLVKRLTVDDNGEIHETFGVPEVLEDSDPESFKVEVVATWREGGLRPDPVLTLTVEKMIETIFLALMATTFAIVIAVPVSFFGARNIMARNPVGTVVYYITRMFFNILRAIEPLIMAIVFAVWVGIGPFAGVLALTIHSIAALGKLYSESIESIDPGPIEAVTATGANTFQTIVYAVIPQIMPQYLAFTIYRWDINVRMSTVIGFVGGGGIGFILQQRINLMRYRDAATAVWAIAIVVATMDYLSAKLREKLI